MTRIIFVVVLNITEHIKEICRHVFRIYEENYQNIGMMRQKGQEFIIISAHKI